MLLEEKPSSSIMMQPTTLLELLTRTTQELVTSTSPSSMKWVQELLLLDGT